ncbi:MAG: GNAT family N-acetyltransferase [Chloroflexi bacterium]|nr:GNAT family N-acetyltransferase [Chloroflexota bacterium]MBP8056928.1 GNAT family N-acetyltransferase [Chloroflexota bacterium]
MAELLLRPITESDLPFLLELYAAARADELAQVPWSDAEKWAFLTSQFNAQHHHYQTYYQTASFDIVEQDGQPIGRFYVDRWPNEIRIVDIALLPNYRQQGIGARLLTQILSEGQASQKTVSIHVEKYNPAYRLYTRLGFSKVGETGVYDLLAWNPTSPAP